MLLAAYSFLLAACAVPVFCMAVVETPVGYIIERLFIGCSLAAFVVCQFWSSIMFSPTVVGLSNAVAGGWGNAGELLRPFCSCLHALCTVNCCSIHEALCLVRNPCTPALIAGASSLASFTCENLFRGRTSTEHGL